jgi:quercetin dioxygenase-like cupin family protein
VSAAPSPPVALLRRAELPELRSVVIDGKEHNLGVHKDFRRSEALARFIPDNARVAMAWVHLEPGEELDVHDHPIESMIVVCRGTGRMVGDLEADLAEGDVIAIPRGKKHGFVGTGTEGYWALSIQFEGRGLYERPEEALVAFSPAKAELAALLAENEALMAAHEQNPLFALVLGGDIATPAVRARLLDCIQIWSRHFQRLVMARLVFNSDPRFGALAREHFVEEYGHDTNLEKSRHGALQKVWDPVLEACAAWFPSKMLSLSDPEKTVLVHLVLEGGAKVFHRAAHPVMAKYDETDHFAVHDVADDGHLEMGVASLEGLDAATYARLRVVQREGWDMLNTLCARMAELARMAAR